ncbi:MAG TPA: murein biosynthesis integral membrane protein MurJ [Woeseiaceae bacterium]|nr:murein biosynthesis integral membrane protein MurJ [Woeseiaceae bacterium]
MKDRKESTGRGLALKASIVSGMTLISRILGVVRDIVFARYFGPGILLDAFLVAQRIPNMLRRFFAEGAFSAGFVPVMARYRENHSEDEAREYIDAMAGTFGIILFVVTLVGVIASPLLVIAVAPGFIGDGGDFDLAALMLRFTFPYLFFISLTAFAGGVLNTYGRFGIPAFTPVILNVVLIVAAIWLSPLLEEPIMALAYAIFIAGLLQLLFQIPALAGIRVFPRPKWRPKNDGVKRAFKLMLPAIFGSSVAQINVLISGIVASLLPIGSISYLYFSDRLMEFPLGLFGIALATVTLPHLSRLWASEDGQTFSDTLDWSMKLAVLIAVPAAIGLIVLAGPFVTTLFYNETFDAFKVEMTVKALQAYAIGLVGFSFVKVLVPAFFAREDTRTPVRIGIISLFVNLALGISLAWYMTQSGFSGPHVGLAIATSAAAILNALLLYRDLRRAGVVTHGNGWPKLLLRVLCANTAMGAVLVLFDRSANWWFDAASLTRVGWLAVTVIAGAGAYFLVLASLGMRTADFRLKQR